VSPRSDRTPNATEIEQLRHQHYNATLVERIDVHDDLARFRVRPDKGVPPFEPGQYVALGLGYWEPRLPGTQGEELPPRQSWKVVRRAYSISCPLLTPQKQLLPCDRCDYLEFYVTLIREADQPPALTPRMFQLQPGDRLAVQSRIVGTYTLAGVDAEDTVVMLATGTGEAPHNAMAARLLAAGHRGVIAVATCARVDADFGYRMEHDVLTNQFPNYRYLTYTTREPRNLNAADPGYVGLERLQTMYTSGRLARDAGIDISPQTTHIFLCGNPMMIGLRRPQDPPLTQPGMLQLLMRDGFTSLHPIDPPGASDQPVALASRPMAGVVRFEKYW
jgi:ferredoxin--NADP+ reductase